MFNSLAPWLSDPPTWLPTTVKAQPPGAAPLQPGDLLLGWQDGQSPSTRAIGIQELFTSTSLTYPFLPLTGGAISGDLSVGGVMMLSRDPSQPLEAATKQYVDGHGGTGPVGGPFLPTAGGVLNSPGNLVIAGTLGVNGEVTVSSNGIKYGGVGSTNDIAFNWNGSVISGYVDATLIGDLATVSSVSTNYLPLLGGTITGNFGVNGNTTLHDTTFAGGLGIAFTGVFNSGVSYAFGWDGTALNYAINGAGQGQLYTVGQNDGRYKAASAYTPNQNVDYNQSPSFFHLYVRGNLGINYANFGTDWFAFGWNGLINCYVDGGYQGDIAFTSWVAANFKNIGAYTPNQNVDGGSGPYFGALVVGGDTTMHNTYNDGGLGIIYRHFSGVWTAFGWNGRVQCWLDGGAAYVELRDTRDYIPNQNVDNGAGPHFSNVWCDNHGIVYAPWNGSAVAIPWDGESVRFHLDGADRGWLVRSSGEEGYTAISRIAVSGGGAMGVWWPGGFAGWSVSFSDRRLKSNIQPSTIDALALVNRLTFHEADLLAPIPGAVPQHWDCALIADELAEVIPLAVIEHEEGEGYAQINELPLITTMARAIQQLTARVEYLEGRT